MHAPYGRPKDRDLPFLVIGDPVDFGLVDDGVALVLASGVLVGVAVGFVVGFVLLIFGVVFAVVLACAVVGGVDGIASSNVVKPIILPWPSALAVTYTTSTSVTSCLFSCTWA